jgi:hypothetical protein
MTSNRNFSDNHCIYDISVFATKIDSEFLDNLEYGTMLGALVREKYNKDDLDEIKTMTDNFNLHKKIYEDKLQSLRPEYEKKMKSLKDSIEIEFKEQIEEKLNNFKSGYENNTEDSRINYKKKLIYDEMCKHFCDFIKEFNKIQDECNNYICEFNQKIEKYMLNLHKKFTLVCFKFLNYCDNDTKLLCETTANINFNIDGLNDGDIIKLDKTDVHYVSSEANTYVQNYYKCYNSHFEHFELLSYHDVEDPVRIKRSNKLKTKDGKIKITNLMKNCVNKNWIIRCAKDYCATQFIVLERYNTFLLCILDSTFGFFPMSMGKNILVIIPFECIYSIPYKYQEKEIKKIIEELHNDD